jgi:hypothetical protein
MMSIHLADTMTILLFKKKKTLLEAHPIKLETSTLNIFLFFFFFIDKKSFPNYCKPFKSAVQKSYSNPAGLPHRNT